MHLKKILSLLASGLGVLVLHAQSSNRQLFTGDWRFQLDSVKDWHIGEAAPNWQKVVLPHDWSISMPFDSTSPTGTGGGALRGGMGWYRKEFDVAATDKGKQFLLDFDGVYCNSKVFVNGQLVGERPNGYISFRYDIAPYLKFGGKNIIVVQVDNLRQPNSRWYSGSGIYRNVWLTKAEPLHIAYNGNYIQTSISDKDVSAAVSIQSNIENPSNTKYSITYVVKDKSGKAVWQKKVNSNTGDQHKVEFVLQNPIRWTLENPYQYSLETILSNSQGKVVDVYRNKFGVRSYKFDSNTGFSLNGKSTKIIGVCMHHDLGALGTAVNKRAIERQLQILKSMGVNGIRTSHNPPAPELLDLCDSMGFVVMAEAFDMWKMEKNPYDYHLYWDQWHEKDLHDFIVRDRNHPSIFVWSVGNEIPEQGWGAGGAKDTSGRVIIRELVDIVKRLDDRPTVTANNETGRHNNLLVPNVTDLIGYNYHHQQWDSVQKVWGDKPFIVTESVSALQTRGHYDMPSDSIRIWPTRWDLPLDKGNADLSCSAYENCATPWGSTHEQTLKVLINNPRISGMYVWTGFDYIGEPTPYPWPARSSYFGIVDLAGFPKDAYYLYKSLFTKETVLHLLPHWNWKAGQKIDVWAYYNNADEVELFLNGQSQGIRKKTGNDLHVVWNLVYQPGTLLAISRKNGHEVKRETIKTAGTPYKLRVVADRSNIKSDGEDLSFLTVRVEDKDGNLVPDADNQIHFSIKGNGLLVATDNGSQTDLTSFQSPDRKALNGLALGVVRSTKEKGNADITVTAEGLQSANVSIQMQ